MSPFLKGRWDGQKSMDVRLRGGLETKKIPRVFGNGPATVSVLAGWLPGLASRARG